MAVPGGGHEGFGVLRQQWAQVGGHVEDRGSVLVVDAADLAEVGLKARHVNLQGLHVIVLGHLGHMHADVAVLARDTPGIDPQEDALDGGGVEGGLADDDIISGRRHLGVYLGLNTDDILCGWLCTFFWFFLCSTLNF